MGRSSNVTKPQRRDADTKLPQGRVSVLELANKLANELDNDAKACRQGGLDRTGFYEH